MNTIIQVAALCYKESLRHKILYGVFTLSFTLMFFSLFISGLFMRDILKIILDICLSAITIGGLLVPFFMAINVVAADINQKTIYSILSRPVPRYSFIIGKFLGLTYLSFTIMGILTGMTLLTLWVASFLFQSHFLQTLSIPTVVMAIVMKTVAIMVLNSVALLWSIVTTSSFLATLLTVSTFLIGQTIEDVVRFISIEHVGVTFSPIINITTKVCLYLFPNLSAFNFNQHAAYGLPIPWLEILFSSLYGFTYISSILLLTVFFFNKRDLT